ncbi:MAG: hypothetical protein ACI85U_002526 [Candidatus Promineifilaceae bacterium]|jgi:hypothetical protein
MSGVTLWLVVMDSPFATICIGLQPNHVMLIVSATEGK